MCHAINTDCMLIEVARAHAVNEHWARQMTNKLVCTFKVAYPAGRSTF